MFGIVVGTRSDHAYLYVSGLSEAVTAPFSEIKSGAQVLDYAEVVECALYRRDGLLCAKEIEILAGARERDALRKMQPFADWEQGDRRTHNGTAIQRHHGAGRR